MNKRRKLIFIIIILLLLIFIGTGIFLFYQYNSDSSLNNSTSESYGDDIGDISSINVFYDSYEDVINYLESTGVSATFDKEADGYWYFNSDNGTYKYSTFDGSLVLES